MPLVSGGVGDGGASMLVTMLKSMLHEYAQRRHSSHEVHGTAALLRPAADGTTTPRRYSEDAQHWIVTQARRSSFLGFSKRVVGDDV
ncbi:hypothetical protein HPB52_019735 [Rhipicephalus sanguineus]|uniref:Uncharacterized protein n=1 Tax=Rhipicephalus sanguineus TaxID=34632 RepID=A0A9D4Q337_RHISA|nr:hypothetical protein HPB52_019735 [Rhipicephalus sanguineus]